MAASVLRADFCVADGRVINPPLPSTGAGRGKEYLADGRFDKLTIKPVVPAKAGIQEIPRKRTAGYREFWIPAFAGTTVAWAWVADGCLVCPG